ncbi:unnamed protein product [Rhizoctonia solani]|uniref:Uncharacterized protein n=1 Tax=Rhizoctonia solani TaxID=456999 RepID=A0A8H3GMD8_9AGAM|nr:unnamed protein product [Rhizoctonia solani]
MVPPVAKLPHPPSPRNVPLPLSPPQSPSLCPTGNHSSPIISALVSSDSMMRYRASQGIQSPRPIRTRQNTQSGRVVPTLRLISSPDGIDPQPDVDITQAEFAEKMHAALERSTTPLDEQANLKGEGLKLEPQLERILTPPPAFWSPPPNSAVIRTSAPLPSLPAGNVSTPTRATSISLPAARTSSAPPLRPMSVPPSGDSLRVGDSEDVRRAWSCQPATAELPSVKSFAGDWRQCMVIEVSDDEEEEEEETTDTDFSELEDEDMDDCQVLDVIDVVADGDLITLPVPKSNSVGDARMSAVSQDKPAESRAIGKGVVSSGIGSGVNAVEAVQNAILRLTLDNAEAAHSQRAIQARPRRLVTPVRGGSMTGAYPTMNQPFSRQSLDFERPRSLNSIHALPNQYLATIPHGSLAANLPGYHHLPANFALESLRSGLELRAAASATAVEEAVRARSASPSITPQDAHASSSRPNPGFILPPRLQRLQSIHSRTSTPVPNPRLDIPVLQQRQPSYESPLRSAPPVMSLYPGVFNVPQYPVPASQFPIIPLVQGRSPITSNVCTPILEQPAFISRQSSALEASANSNRAQLANIIVDNKPVPPAPATAPLPRNNGRHKRQTRRSAEAVLSNSEDPKLAPVVPVPAPATSEPAPSVETPTTQSSASSPRPKQKGGKKRWHKYRKNLARDPIEPATTTPSTSVTPPKPKENTPTPKKASVSPPKKASAPMIKSGLASTSMSNESSSSTPKPKRKYKSSKKHRSAKPGAVATVAPAVPT